MVRRLQFIGQDPEKKSPSRPLENGRCDDLFAVVVDKKKTPAIESKANCTEFIRYDENGDVIADTVRKSRSQNGSGFVISYTAKMCDFVVKTTQGSVVRLFVYLAHNQQFGVDGQPYGCRCSHKFLRQLLGVDKKTIYNALKYLKDNFLVIETEESGQSEFMVNPDYVTIGTDKRARMREWNERWARHWKSVAAAGGVG